MKLINMTSPMKKQILHRTEGSQDGTYVYVVGERRSNAHTHIGLLQVYVRYTNIKNN